MISNFKTVLAESFTYREVLFNILSQHLKVKYKRTVLGYVWSLLNPVLQLAVLTVVFSHIPKVSTPHYTLYLFAGLMPWTFFSNALLMGASSLLENESFIKKIYLPKIIFPLSKVLLAEVDFLFSLIALSLIALILGFQFHWTIVMLPIALVLFFIFVAGASVMISVATVFFRDVQYLVGVFLNLLYFLTPILYPISAMPEKYHKFLVLNPLFVFIDLFQKLIYSGRVPSLFEWSLALCLSLVTFFGAIMVLVATDQEIVFRM